MTKRLLDADPPFTIPSGIITVTTDSIRRVAKEVGVGLITTKSVGLTPFDGYPEPIFSQYSLDSLSTAVGLSTCGVDRWVEEARAIYPLTGKYLLTSIFASNVADFVTIARKVSTCTDGIELNFCCPHSLEYGAAVGRQEELTLEITRAVRQAVGKMTIVAKLTPDGPQIGKWSKRLVEAGADAIAAIGPTKAITVLDKHTGKPILSYGSGGLSGPAIRERAIECVRDVRKHTDVPIIAGGGIRGARDVQEFRQAGGNLFAIGTSLAGMGTAALKRYFEQLRIDLANGSDYSREMSFCRELLHHRVFRITKVSRNAVGAEITFDQSLAAEPGQFVFAWLPGVGEKPLGVAGVSPLVIGVAAVGMVTRALCALEPGAEVMIRGPYGNGLGCGRLGKVIVVAAGCGAAPLRHLAREAKEPMVFLGARSADRLFFANDFDALGNVHVSTDDGSRGFRGTVVDCLAATLPSIDLSNAVFVNCGPEPMLRAAVEVEQKHVPRNRIFVGLERYTACGVGLCGKCALDGYRTCVDGPFMSAAAFADDTAFGRWRREPSGHRVAF